MSVKVFITGGAGFIGRRLIKFLISKKYDIYCGVRKTNVFAEFCGAVKEINFSLDKIEKTNCSFLAEFDYIYHLAGVTKHFNKNYFYQKQTSQH